MWTHCGEWIHGPQGTQKGSPNSRCRHVPNIARPTVVSLIADCWTLSATRLGKAITPHSSLVKLCHPDSRIAALMDIDVCVLRSEALTIPKFVLHATSIWSAHLSRGEGDGALPYVKRVRRYLFA